MGLARSVKELEREDVTLLAHHGLRNFCLSGPAFLSSMFLPRVCFIIFLLS